MLASPDQEPLATFLPRVWFCELSLQEVVQHAEAGEPWSSFAAVQQALDRGNRFAAVSLLHGLVEKPGLESLQRAQAWHFLRQIKFVVPERKVKEILGVVVEVGTEGGLDVLAAYPDGRARYLNFSGSPIIWEHPDSSLDVPIETLMNAARKVVQKIGPWLQPRREGLELGHIRLSMLTPSGLHFGEGPMDVLSSDPFSAPLVRAATTLLAAMIRKTGVLP